MPPCRHRDTQDIRDPDRAAGMRSGLEQPGVDTGSGQETVNTGFATGHTSHSPQAVSKQPAQDQTEIQWSVEGLGETQRPTQSVQAGKMIEYFQGAIHCLCRLPFLHSPQSNLSSVRLDGKRGRLASRVRHETCLDGRQAGQDRTRPKYPGHARYSALQHLNRAPVMLRRPSPHTDPLLLQSASR